MTTLAAPEEAVTKPAAVPADAPPRRRRVWPWLVAAVLLVGVFAIRGAGSKAAPGGKGRDAAKAVPVVTTEARAGDVPVYLRGLGTATAFKTATLRSRVDGQLESVAVHEGQAVAEGQLLAQIDPRPFQVQVEQAEGQLAKDQAALKDAQINLERLAALYQEQIVPQQQLDSQHAQVREAEGAIQSDQAQVDSARLQLSYSRVTAPFAGRIGLRLVDPGNLVRATDPNGLFVLTQVQPIAVVFSLPQDELGGVLSRLKANQTLEVEAYDRDNTKKVATGKLLTTDNQIDTSTGTYKLKAVFDNQDDALFPNQFVNARLHLDTKRGLVLVPSAAVQRGSGGTFVYVVEADQTAHVRPVTVALSEGADSGLLQGLQAGDVVVVDGQDKLQDGSKVQLPGQEPAADKPPAGKKGGGRGK